MGKSKLKKDLMRYWVQLLKLNKIDRLRINVDERKITRDNTESLLKDLGNGILDGHEFKNGHKNIANDVEAIVNKPLMTRNEEKIVEIMSLLKEILKSKSDEKLNITDMSELESEESAAKRRNQQGQGLNILTPNQMLSRLPITLAQLKAWNNSKKKLKNEIKQLLCSLYCSKKLIKTIYNNLINII